MDMDPEKIPLIRIEQVEEPPSVGAGEQGSSEEPGTGSLGQSLVTSRDEDDDSSNNASSEGKSPGQRTKSNQRWMKLRTTVQLSSAISTIQKKPPLKREDSFLKRFSTRQIPETQETVEDTGSEGGGGGGAGGNGTGLPSRRRRRAPRPPRTVVNPDENFYFYWLWVLTGCVLYNLWTLIVRQSFPELQQLATNIWFACDCLTDLVFAADLVIQLRTGYLEQGLMVYDSRKLAGHYLNSRAFLLDLASLTPLDLLQLRFGTNPMLRFPRFLKVYRAINCYYIVESRTVYPNFWRVINLIHILLILAHWFGCFYFLLSEAEKFQGDWVYPHRPGDYATLTRKYLGSLYWSTLTLTTIGDLPTPETNAEASQSADGPKSLPRRGLKSRLLQFNSNKGYIFTIVSYLIGVFIFATIVGQVGNVITNRNANRLEFERLLDGAKTYMRHHKVPGGMKRRVLRWYDYSWSRGRIQGGGDINTALGLLPDKLKTELALHVNLSVLKKVTIFQECQPEFLHDLVLKMKAYIFTPGDSICRKGEVAREMFIIADGILEVISETGRVLTTMKAGDFFGEIGILNLDGLNKRTADVRSVGYSELFSLSREDVLAAMKDYPEAQEILQTLGRKRLQEARSCNRKAKKESEEGDLDDEKGGTKRIVHKIRSDVKGIRNALRSRTRPTRRSGTGESLELRALGAGAATALGAAAAAGPKGVLRRMPRVESDETHHVEGGGEADPSQGAPKEEKAISPLGAGLPLLARLKLLKERQEREEKEANRQRGLTIPQLGPPCQPNPTPSTSAPSEPEVIGAGLPLLQRLLLLKAKEERERNMAGPSTSGIEKMTLSSNPPSSSDTISPSSLKSPLSPTVKTLSPMRKTSGSSSPGKPISPTAKASRKNSSGSSDSSSKPKVSFKDKIMKLQGDGTSVVQPLSKDKDDCDKKTKNLSDVKVPIVITSEKQSPGSSESGQITAPTQTISIPTSVVNKLKSPAKAVGTTFRDKLKLLQGGAAPVAKDSVETVPNKIDSVKKINLDVKQFIQSAEIQATASDKSAKEESKAKKPWSKLKKAAILGDSRESSRQSSVNLDSPQDKNIAKTDTSAKNIVMTKLTLGKKSAVASSSKPSPSCIVTTSDNNNVVLNDMNLDASESESKQAKISQESISRQSDASRVSSSQLSEALRSPRETLKRKGDDKQCSVLVTRRNKTYVSVADLSPEYGTLPFVKKLKILNERQKLEELEKEVKKTRSSSLDCTETVVEVDILTRSNSEGSTMGRVMCNNIGQLGVASIVPRLDGSQQLPSPESNETLERRNLKSILKKLSEDTQVQEQPVICPKEFKKLIRAPTIEGYAARHSKFAKSVTFNRDTVTSPPDSANQQKPLFPISNPYQRLTSVQSNESPEVAADDSDDIWACDDEPPSPASSDILMDVENILQPVGEILSEKTSELDLRSPLDPKYRYTETGLEGLHPEEIKVPKSKPKLSLISAVTNQRKIYRGSIEEQEYFGEVLLGIKHVIQGHLREVQGKFQDRFNNLEMEVRKRDEIISQLQNRIQELERVGLTGIGGAEETSRWAIDMVPPLPAAVATDVASLTLTASEGSDDISADQGFMRGDSLDTVFTTSPPSMAMMEEEEEEDEDEELEEGEELPPESQMEFQVDREATKPRRHSLVGTMGYSSSIEDDPLLDEEILRRLSVEQLQQMQQDLHLYQGLHQRQMEHQMLQNECEQLERNGRVTSRTKKVTRKMELRLEGADVTYSRKRAARLRERRSWEESTEQEEVQLQDLPRSMSPLAAITCEEHALLSPSRENWPTSGSSAKSSARRRSARGSHHFHLFGSHLDPKGGKMKKTLSVDTGIHHTGKSAGASSQEQEHRKFSLGSFFGYHRGAHSSSSKQSQGHQQNESVVLDMESEYGSSDGNSSSSSGSDQSDYMPRTPVFEHFQHRGSHSGGADLGRRGGGSDGGGGDWEVVMLAEELERRERNKAEGARKAARGAQSRRSAEQTQLRSLEEEQDPPPQSPPPPVPPRRPGSFSTSDARRPPRPPPVTRAASLEAPPHQQRL